MTPVGGRDDFQKNIDQTPYEGIIEPHPKRLRRGAIHRALGGKGVRLRRTPRYS